MDKASLIAQSYQFTPTSEQLLFCREMALFLSRPLDRQCFILRVMPELERQLRLVHWLRALPKFGYRSILLAPTGRAAKVMSNYTGRNALTIHKKIYRKKTAVSTEMSFLLAPNLAEYTVFIVDEASMIADEWNIKSGSSFLKDLMQYAYNGKNCGIIFVGDTAQLPPVGSVDSPALNATLVADQFGIQVIEVELTQVVRQEKKSGILANATMLREIINNYQQEEDEIPLPKFLTKSYKDIFRMTGLKLVEGLEYAYRKFDIENTLVVCRSNKSANVYNQQIRARLLYRDEELTGGRPK